MKIWGINWSTELQENTERKNTLAAQQLSIACYQVSLCALNYFEWLPIVSIAFNNWSAFLSDLLEVVLKIFDVISRSSPADVFLLCFNFWVEQWPHPIVVQTARLEIRTEIKENTTEDSVTDEWLRASNSSLAATSSGCGFESWSWHLCPHARHLTVRFSSPKGWVPVRILCAWFSLFRAQQTWQQRLFTAQGAEMV